MGSAHGGAGPVASSSIPVKAFGQAKRRLGSALPEQDRVQLVRSMATHVLSACRTHSPLPWSATTKRWPHWASDLGATVMWEPGQGLNGAVGAGVRRLVEAGTESDHRGPRRPAPRPRAGCARRLRRGDPRARPARRRHQRGAVCPARAADFRFAYGPGSFAGPPGRGHAHRAGRCGWCATPNLAYDVDWPADVDELIRTTTLSTPSSPTPSA